MNLFESQEIRNAVIESFPALEQDPNFRITSPSTDSYNCIAWAVNRNNAFWWPSVPQPDGSYWPLENKSENFQNLIDAYKTVGYLQCADWNFDPKYKKVALYINTTTGNFTHASRQLRSGLWTSKLGCWYDITHSTPYTIEGDAYGIVNAFMQIKF